MFKQILGNNRGMSLMETVVASAISIVIAMGVMQINQNASKGMSRIQSKNNLIELKQDIRRKLSAVDKDTGVKTCTTALNSSFGTDIISSKVNLLNAGDSFSVDGGVTTEFVVGQELEAAPGIKVVRISRKAFDNGGLNSNQGRCDLELELQNVRDGQKGTFQMWIPIVCIAQDYTVSPIRMDHCGAADNSRDFGLGEMAVDPNGRDVMTFNGGTGGAFMIVGSSPDLLSTATLSLFPETPANQSNIGDTSAIDMPYGAAILWGDEVDGTDTIGIHGYDNSGTDTLVLTATEVSIPSTLKDLTQLNVQNIYASGEVHAVGDMYAPNYYNNSDRDLKKDIKTLERVSDKLDKIRGVTYFMRADEFPQFNFSREKQIGLIAQEIEEVFPELVSISPVTKKRSVSYGAFGAVLLQALKEQKEEIKQNREMLSYLEGDQRMKDLEQDARIEQLERENQYLREELEALHNKLDRLIELQK